MGYKRLGGSSDASYITISKTPVLWFIWGARSMEPILLKRICFEVGFFY